MSGYPTVGCGDIILPEGGVTFLVLRMVALALAFMLQGKSIRHIGYELFLLPESIFFFHTAL